MRGCFFAWFITNLINSMAQFYGSVLSIESLEYWNNILTILLKIYRFRLFCRPQLHKADSQGQAEHSVGTVTQKWTVVPSSSGRLRRLWGTHGKLWNSKMSGNPQRERDRTSRLWRNNCCIFWDGYPKYTAILPKRKCSCCFGMRMVLAGAFLWVPFFWGPKERYD